MFKKAVDSFQSFQILIDKFVTSEKLTNTLNTRKLAYTNYSAIYRTGSEKFKSYHCLTTAIRTILFWLFTPSKHTSKKNPFVAIYSQSVRYLSFAIVMLNLYDLKTEMTLPLKFLTDHFLVGFHRMPCPKVYI